MGLHKQQIAIEHGSKLAQSQYKEQKELAIFPSLAILIIFAFHKTKFVKIPRSRVVD